MGSKEEFEPRRYAGVMLRSDVAPEALLQSFGATESTLRAVAVPSAGWSFNTGIVAVETKYSRSPSRAAGPDGRFTHRIYAGAGSVAGVPCVFVASPFVRFLADSLARLDTQSDQGLTYYKPAMASVFSHFETARPTELSATRISVLMEGDVGLEVVSLSGRNPLRSDLRHALLDVASPYSIRVKGTYIDRRGSNIHADRHGNFWFHLGTQDALVNVAALLSVLASDGEMSVTASSPLKRIVDEDAVL